MLILKYQGINMKHFQRIVFALVFGFFGAILLSNIPKELPAYSQGIMGRTNELISMESTENNGVEVNGVRFEILVPERVWTIPPNQPGAETPVKIGMRITNHNSQAFRFSRFDGFYPIIARDGKRITGHIHRDGGFAWPRVSDCPLLQPRESTTFVLDAKLFWEDNQLQFECADGFGGKWYFNNIQAGTHQISLGYSIKIPSPLSMYMYDPDTQRLIPFTDGWEGSAKTPFIQINIV